ncbi:MAG: dockerin type I domain-containing protein [Clostridiales bacterium]|nr:dockerin type I domain-containing protein [Clostridiales bacterium]
MSYIQAYAFSGCENLSHVIYTGDDWYSIEFEENGNGNDEIIDAYNNATGDISGNGVADNEDAAIIMKQAIDSILSGDVSGMGQADVNHDGNVDILDAIQILKEAEAA